MVGVVGAGRDAGADAATARAKAALEVCAASAAFAYCAHRRSRRPPPPPSSRGGTHFVDWYLVLAIGEAASADAVRRRYRQLALQLHPDKNKHPKAEKAFKIVSEAHACLTDQARRREFDAERRLSYCAACHDRHAARWSSQPQPPTLRPAAGGGHHHHQAPASSAASSCRSRSSKQAQAAVREAQSRLRDECRVIDRCVRANDAAARARRRQSFPVFDPSSHSDTRRFPDYPHVRPPPPAFGFGVGVGVGAGAEEQLRRFQERLGRAQARAVDQQQALNRRWCRDGGGESPVYQIKTATATECTDGRAW